MTTPPTESAASRPVLLVADDGARDAAGAAALRDFVDALGRHSPELPVAGGHLAQLPDAALAPAVAELLAGGGPARLTAVPLTLAPAAHAERAVSSALERARERQPAVSYAYGLPLGGHPVLLDALERRVEDALGTGARTPGDRGGVTVLLVGRGSADPEANAEVHRVARLLWEGRGYAGVEAAFVSPAAPDVPSGLDRCARLGARRIVVLPYFLLDGAVPERLRAQAEGWAEAHPEVEVRTAAVVGPDPALLDLVVRRHREAVAVGPVPTADEGRQTPPARHAPQDRHEHAHAH
ncbi:sirohydrochlorin chelatase [Streptomyces cavernicola]|uniref:Sirohydrochlorin chelatase n=1 Tax=Streptomyces cavernicola TaxID=3043613 RepID=A0ABT6SAJ0_9ACTN|nr:sirohydrochlorin chelatase [Streptomyces sp. B-S-A6]MDI3404894.1 sirohydrochlorin chelatase [Streptomyces sp. B-S-A6]